MLLALKLTLAPALVALASIVERRFGFRAAGWTAGFPIVAGPILFFLAHEQGHAFAAVAARQTLLGLVSLSTYCLAYGRASVRFPPAASLALAYLAFAFATAAMSAVSVGLLPALLVALLTLTVARLLLTPPPAAVVAPARPSLLVRMAATAAIVLTVTGLAHVLGPRWSGLLVPFPIASTVLVVAAHRSSGHGGALLVLRGLLPALYGFALFCAAVSFWLETRGLAASFGLGLAGAIMSQALMLRMR